MMVHFEFATATRIIFGPGELSKIGGLCVEMGKKALVITGADAGRAARLLDYLKERGIQVERYQVEGEPTIRIVKKGVELARNSHVDLVISMGGGSALDAGKAIAALVTNPGEIYEYLEVIGKGKPMVQASLPYIAIPTTAGTGSEVTRNAVIGAPEEGIKVSMRSAFMLPRLALVDPELTYCLPADITASTGMDALTQLLEVFVSIQANPMTDAICRQGIRLAARSLRTVVQNGHDVSARQDMAMASLFGGIGLANAKLGAVHGFAAVLGGLYHAPHGSVCARLLPEVMFINVCALFDREPDSPAIDKYLEFANIVTNEPNATPMDGVNWVQSLAKELRIKGLTAYGVEEAQFGGIINKAERASSMKGNPILLTQSELGEVLVRGMLDY